MVETSRHSEVSYDQRLIHTLIRQWGSLASEVLLDSPANYFFTPGIEGCIGYRAVSGFAVSFGDPICRKEDAEQLAGAFQAFCAEKQLDVIYMIVSKWFADLSSKGICEAAIEVGEELIFNPQENSTDGHRASKLRNYLHHAQHLGLRVHEYLHQDEKLEAAMEKVGMDWLKGRRGPMIYLSELQFFNDRSGKRWFYVEQDNCLMAIGLLSKLGSRQGWLLKYLITEPKAPRGTSELLVTSILKQLSDECCSFMAYGIVPAKSLRDIRGLGQISRWSLRLLFKIAKWFFRLNQSKIYWEKFYPHSEPSYILFSKAGVGLKEVRAIMKALKISL